MPGDPNLNPTNPNPANPPNPNPANPNPNPPNPNPNPNPNPPNPNPPQRTTFSISQALPTLFYGAIALAILGVIVWGLWGKEGFLTSLQEIPVARGLITFLIAITTMGIAVMLAISTIFGESGDDQDKTFDKGKQVLSVLIGLLGTIVGFYFGSPDKVAQTTTAATQSQTLTIAPASLSNSQPKKGETIILTSFVYGGKAPYTYSITFDPSVIPPIKDIKSPDGIIKQEIVVPDTLGTDTDVKYQIHVADSDNKTVDFNKDGVQKISLKSK
jgi:hypothetical protein